MVISVIDSHRMMDDEYKEKLLVFFMKVKGISKEVAKQQMESFDSYEKDYAVKWYEINAQENNQIIGYMRIVRNPENMTLWYASDIHVLREFRNQRIATMMYQKGISVVKEHEPAECIHASISINNTKSIKLHSKLGFEDLKVSIPFASFSVAEDETTYRLWLYTYYKVLDIDIHKNILFPLWKEYKCSSRYLSDDELRYELQKLIEKAQNQVHTFELIFCGNKAIGFHYMSNELILKYLRNMTDLSITNIQ